MASTFNKFDPIWLINLILLLYLLLAFLPFLGYLVIPVVSCLNIYAVGAIMKANAITFIFSPFFGGSSLSPPL